MEQLRDMVKDYSDEELTDQFVNHRDEYTPEALNILEEEIKLRQIDTSKIEKKPTKTVKQGTLNLDSDDFLQFEHTFSRTDLILASSVLKDNSILFFADNPSSVDSIPIESESAKRFSIHVHKEFAEKAHELLDEHFEKVGAEYLSRYSSPRDRLRSFNFHDIRISEQEAKELIDVGFSGDEIRVIDTFGNRLLVEVDKIEQEQERVVFFYDSIEPLLDTLKKSSNSRLNRSDLLTILEILQIYCDDPEFPETMDEAILTLLSFFFDN